MSFSADKRSSRSASFSKTARVQNTNSSLLTNTINYMRSTSPETLNKFTKSKPRERKIDRILRNLFQKHEQMKAHIQRLRVEKQLQDQAQFQKLPFSPRITLSPRYQINGFFMNRQEQKLKEKEKVYRQKSREKQREEMKECLFRPQRVAKKVSDLYLKNKKEKTQTQKMNEFQARELHPQRFPKKTEKSKIGKNKMNNGESTYSAMRGLIKFQLSRAQLP